MILFLIRFAVENLKRNPGWSFASLVGVLFAVTLIIAATISVDVSVQNAFLKVVNDTVDLVIWPTGDRNLSTEEILRISSVKGAVPLGIMGYKTQVWVGGKGGLFCSSTVFGVDESFAAIAPKIGILINGSFKLGSREVLLADYSMSPQGISRDWFTEIGRVPQKGDTVNITLGGESGRGTRVSWNFSFGGLYHVDRSTLIGALGYVSRPGMILSLETSRELIQQLGPRPGVTVGSSSGILGLASTQAREVPGVMVCHLVTIDHVSFLEPGSLDNTVRNLEQVAGDVGRNLGLEIGFFLPLERAVLPYQKSLEEKKGFYLLVSLPVVFLGIYLGMIGVDLAHMGRRRDIGLLRCRGLGNREISRILLVESVLLGCVAGVLGVLLGSVLASGVRIPGFEGLSSIGMPGVSSLATGVGIALGMTLVASFRSMKRLRRTKTVDLLSGYSEALAREEYRPRNDLLLVLIPLCIYAAILIGPSGFIWHSGGTLIASIALTIFLVGVLILPFTPILMTVGLSRLLTRGTRRTYSTVCRALTPFVGELGDTIQRNLSRNEKRTVSVAVLIALSVSLGSFIVVLPSTDDLTRERRNIFRVGSDIQVHLRYVSDTSVPERIAEMKEVHEVSIIDIFSDSSTGFTYILVDPETLRTCIEDNPFFDRKVDGALTILEMDKENAIVQLVSIKKSRPKMGSTIIAGIDGRTAAQLKVMGTFVNMPGVSSTIHEEANRFIVGSEVLENFSKAWFDIPMGSRRDRWCVVKAEKGEDIEAVAEKIRSLDPALRERGVTSVPDESEPESLLLPFVRIEFMLCIIMASVGVGLVSSVNARERKREIAQQIARGMSRRQVASLLGGESIVTAIVGISIGMLAGLLPSYLYEASIVKSGGITIPVALSIPPSVIILPALAFAAIGLVSMTVAVRTGRLKLHQVLRVRH